MPHAPETTSGRFLENLGVDLRRCLGHDDEDNRANVGRESPPAATGLALAGGWRAWTLDGLRLPGTSPELAARLCDASFQALVLGADGLPLSMGRKVRLFQPHQRLAIDIRDGGCVFPGCPLPPSALRYHHLDFWERDHGNTDVHRGAGLCDHDHGIAHRTGWAMFITPDGWTWFRPPNGRSFWGQRHGVQHTGPTPDQPGYVAPQRVRAARSAARDPAPGHPAHRRNDAREGPPADPLVGLVGALEGLRTSRLKPCRGDPDRSAVGDVDRGAAPAPASAPRLLALERIRARLAAELVDA